MTYYRQRNLKIQSAAMGQLVIQPIFATAKDITASRLVVYPFRIPSPYTDTVVEWAARSQTPIFCHRKDFSALELEGFGAYRFHGLDQYRVVDFQDGSLEFFPARRPREHSFAGLVKEATEWLGMRATFSYHVVVRAHGERPLLFLASPELDRADWKVFSRLRPALIVGAEEFPRESWTYVEQKFQTEIIWAGDVDSVATRPEKSLVAGPSDEIRLRVKERSRWTKKKTKSPLRKLPEPSL